LLIQHLRSNGLFYRYESRVRELQQRFEIELQGVRSHLGRVCFTLGANWRALRIASIGGI
jgi:hypothetical protein